MTDPVYRGRYRGKKYKRKIKSLDMPDPMKTSVPRLSMKSGNLLTSKGENVTEEAGRMLERVLMRKSYEERDELKKIRVVRTMAGAAKYGVSIGQPIKPGGKASNKGSKARHNLGEMPLEFGTFHNSPHPSHPRYMVDELGRPALMPKKRSSDRYKERVIDARRLPPPAPKRIDAIRPRDHEGRDISRWNAEERADAVRWEREDRLDAQAMGDARRIKINVARQRNARNKSKNKKLVKSVDELLMRKSYDKRSQVDKGIGRMVRTMAGAKRYGAGIGQPISSGSKRAFVPGKDKVRAGQTDMRLRPDITAQARRNRMSSRDQLRSLTDSWKEKPNLDLSAAEARRRQARKAAREKARQAEANRPRSINQGGFASAQRAVDNSARRRAAGSANYLG